MLSTIVYILFFAALNACINSSLWGMFVITFRIKMGVYVFALLFFIMHLVVPDNDFLLPVKLFYILLMFSIAIVIVHFMAKRAAKRTDATIASNPRLAGSATAAKFVQVRSFIISGLFPAMIFIFQVLVICSPDVQYGMLHPN
jgi:preprotein translocase subunit SecG